MAINEQMCRGRLDELDTILGVAEKTKQLIEATDKHYNMGGERKAEASFRVKVGGADARFINSLTTKELAQAIQSIAERHVRFAFCFDGYIKRPGMFRSVWFNMVVRPQL